MDAPHLVSPCSLQAAACITSVCPPGGLHAVHQHRGSLSGEHELQSPPAVRVHPPRAGRLPGGGFDLLTLLVTGRFIHPVVQNADESSVCKSQHEFFFFYFILCCRAEAEVHRERPAAGADSGLPGQRVRCGSSAGGRRGQERSAGAHGGAAGAQHTGTHTHTHTHCTKTHRQTQVKVVFLCLS